MHAEQPPAQQTAQVFNTNLGTPLVNCIEAVARRWFGFTSPEEIEKNTSSLTSENTPNVLRTWAERYGIGLEFAHRRAISMLPQKYPCIYVLDNGTGVVAEGLARDGIKLLTDKGTVIVSADSLEKQTQKLVIVPSSRDITIDSFQDTPEQKSRDGDVPRSPVRWLINEISKENKVSITLLFLATAISNMLMITLPLFIMSVYDRVIPHGALETLWALSIGVVIALSVDLGIRSVKLKLSDSIAISTSLRIQTRLMSALTNASVQSVPRNVSVWTSAFRDVDNATSLVPAIMASVLIDIPFVILVLFLIYSIGGLTVLAPVAGISMFAAWTFIGKNKISQVGEKEALCQNARTEVLDQTANNIKIVKSTNSQNAQISVLERLLDASIASTHDLRQRTGMQSQTTMVVVQLVIVAAIILGVYQISAGNMTVGALAATTLLVGRVLLPAGNSLMLFARYGQMSKSLDRVLNLLDLPQEAMRKTRESKFIDEGCLELHSVDFGFENSAIKTLSNLSLTINKGEKVAIIGKSGSGKSTLMQIFCRLYEPTAGTFLIDHFDSRQFSHFETRKSISYMPQDSQLFDGSIYDNLLVGNPRATRDQALHALKISGALDFIRALPDGLSFAVGRNGERLSGGQRQAIALARSILSASKVVLLDEPTSSMDNTTENFVIANIRKEISDKTLIIATHRASVLSIVDRIIWLDQGKIIADGPRDEVLSRLQSAA